MGKWCPAGMLEKIYDEFGNLLIEQPYLFRRLFRVGQEQVINGVGMTILECGLENNIVTTKVLLHGPWPSRQVPVEKPHDEHDVKDFFQESVNQTVDTVRAYRQGRFDMKREIGDEVKKKIALRWCVMSSEGILLELQEYIEGVK